MKNVVEEIIIGVVGVDIGWRVWYVIGVYVGDPPTLVLQEILMHVTHSNMSYDGIFIMKHIIVVRI